MPRLSSLVEVHAIRMAIFLLLIHITLGAISAAQDSATFDEGAHLAFGTDLLAGKLEHASMQRMPITAINAIPKMACHALGIHLAPEQELFVARLPSLILATLTGWIIFVWSRRLHGPRGALLSTVLFVLCPTFLAHDRLVTTDAVCALLFLAATLLFVRDLRRPSWTGFLLAAGVTGVAQLTKHTALLLFPLFVTILVLHRWARPGIDGAKRPRHATARAFLFLAIVVVIINAGYGFKGTGESFQQHVDWLHSTQGGSETRLRGDGLLHRVKARALHMPLPLPRVYVEAYLLGQHFNRTGEGHGPVYLLGDISKFGWRSYFPIALLLKTPLPSLVLIVVALAVSLRRLRLRLISDELVCLLSAAVVFSYFTLACTAQIGIRYLLPMLPFLYILVGRLASWCPPRCRWLWSMGGATLLIWLALSSLSYFPHHICYFNEICWDRRFLFRYLADSNLDRGQNGRHLDQYLQLHRDESIPVDPPSPSAGIFIVGANKLVGIDGSPATYRWLRENHAPVAHVAYSHLVFSLPRRMAESDRHDAPTP